MSLTISGGHRNATIAGRPINQDLTQRSTMETNFHGYQTLLSQEEIEILTGLKRPTFQCKWLRENAIVFLVGADGKPKVLTASLMSRVDKNIKNGNRKQKEPEVRV